MTSRRTKTSVERDAAELYQAATAFIRLYQFRSRDQAVAFGLTVVQAYTLDILVSSEGESLTSVADTLRLDKSTTSRVIAGMTRRGLVKWSRAGHDRRTKNIVASSEGTRRYLQFRRAIIRDNERMLVSYKASHRRSVIAALWDLTAIASSRLESELETKSAGRDTSSRAKRKDK
jgi:MarR family transcriptional regulator, 2-MHQ and catechol-resistance regulon repressor